MVSAPSDTSIKINMAPSLLTTTTSVLTLVVTAINFHDESFAVGNTSQVWSVNSTNMVSPELAFDGRLKTWLSNVTNTGERGGFTFTNLTVNSSLIIYRSSFTDGKIFINGTTELDILASADDVGTPIDTGFTGALTSVEIQTGSKGAIYGIEVDGELLIDANIQDTVVDTPIKSYAVLTAGSNGNLETPITGIVPATYGSSDNIYWECTKHDNTELNVRVSPMDTTDATASFYYSTVQGIWSEFGSSTSTSGITPLGTGDRVGVAINFATDNLTIFANDSAIISTGLNGNTKLRPSVAQSGAAAFNFGQQPFAASNVTHDLAAGTVEIDGVTYSTLYQELEGYQVAGGYFYDEKNQRAVRGSDLRKRFGITSADPQLGIYDLTEVPSHQVIGYEKVGSKYQALRDYTPEVRTAQAETTAVTAELTEAQATITAQRQMIIRAACTWVVGKAYEEGDIILFNGHVFKALTATTATADNDPGDETGDWEFLGLEEDTAPTVIDGYYPLYTTEAASNAAGNGSSHTHTFDGVTYYMPNGGTTIYHGTYTGYSY